jgi:histone-lysine N-methyltransferase SETMAR
LKTGELIQANRQTTVPELSQEVGIGVGSVEEILHSELVGSKVSARWVPRLLTTEHRERRLVAVAQLLQQYEGEGAEFLDSLVTSDDTWAHYFTPESKTYKHAVETHRFSTPQKKRKQFFLRR